jgi:thymidylate synthase (FAD)
MIEVESIDHMGSDLSVVNAARVSFKKESHAEEWRDLFFENRSGAYVAVLNGKDFRLIQYLAEHQHYSPFGHCFASFYVKAPIFVARQLVKHEYLRWNEVSRRYVDDEPEFYVPEVWRGRSADKKQGSEGISVWNHGQGTGYREHEYEVMTDIRVLYDRMIEVGVAPEQARMVLPLSTMTEWYWSGSLDAFANMCKLRLKPDTQYETRLVAEKISEVMESIWPVSWKALVK